MFASPNRTFRGGLVGSRKTNGKLGCEACEEKTGQDKKTYEKLFKDAKKGVNQMKNIYQSALIALAVGLMFDSSAFAQHQAAEQEAVQKFKQYTSDLMVKYKAEKYERTEHAVYCPNWGPGAHGYVKAAYEPDSSYKIDVRKTDSLITPYVGILWLQWDKRYSDCKDTREEAQTQSDLPNRDHLAYQYKYGFQDGHWIPQDRLIGSVTEQGIRWEFCGEEKAYLEPKGY